LSINNSEELIEHLSAISHTQTFILKEIKTLREKVEEPYNIIHNLLFEINKLKQTNEKLESVLANLIADKNLENISAQLNKLKLGPSSSGNINTKFILAKPRPKKNE